jgi:(E)-4-hydroxy-3-methyl-but-2-enyl pyrophosphate reductase
MKIKLAGESGFCFGVKKALDRISSIKDKKGAFVLGKLIHNPQVISKLKEEGLIFTDNLDEITRTLIISAHGASDDILKIAEQKNLNLIDTTCPLVKNVHNITKNLEAQGYTIIIFGDKNHTEVKGIKGNLNNPIIISSLSELDAVKQGKYALVSQTTQDVEAFNKIAQELKIKNPDLVVSDTICYATKSRQKNAKELAKEVDLMLVIGGHDSANTRRLRNICEKIVETKQIESYRDIKKEWFQNKNIIGLTAGASTPKAVIEEVISALNHLNQFK